MSFYYNIRIAQYCDYNFGIRSSSIDIKVTTFTGAAAAAAAVAVEFQFINGFVEM